MVPSIVPEAEALIVIWSSSSSLESQLTTAGSTFMDFTIIVSLNVTRAGIWFQGSHICSQKPCVSSRLTTKRPISKGCWDGSAFDEPNTFRKNHKFSISCVTQVAGNVIVWCTGCGCNGWNLIFLSFLSSSNDVGAGKHLVRRSGVRERFNVVRWGKLGWSLTWQSTFTLLESSPSRRDVRRSFRLSNTTTPIMPDSSISGYVSSAQLVSGFHTLHYWQHFVPCIFDSRRCVSCQMIAFLIRTARWSVHVQCIFFAVRVQSLAISLHLIAFQTIGNVKNEIIACDRHKSGTTETKCGGNSNWINN